MPFDRREARPLAEPGYDDVVGATLLACTAFTPAVTSRTIGGYANLGIPWLGSPRMSNRDASMQPDPAALLGQTDIYLLDQLLRGRIRPGMSLLDVGCAGGRNLTYFLRAGYDVTGVDPDAGAIESVRALAAELAPDLPPERFRAGSVEDLAALGRSFDVVVCIAVLHFARDEAHFDRMLRGLWSAVRPGGMFLARLASSIGIEERIEPLGGRRFLLPDGTQRFLVDEARLLAATEALGGTLLDPIKTTNVQNLRCMTTWAVRA